MKNYPNSYKKLEEVIKKSQPPPTSEAMLKLKGWKLCKLVNNHSRAEIRKCKLYEAKHFYKPPGFLANSHSKPQSDSDDDSD